MENESRLDDGDESIEEAAAALSELEMEKRRLNSADREAPSRRPKRNCSKLSAFISSNRAQQQQPPEDAIVVDVYEKAESAKNLIRKPTGIVYDREMSQHRCEYDDNYIEHPRRYEAILTRCTHLMERCERLHYDFPTMDDLKRVHMQDHIETLRRTSLIKVDEREARASRYDSVYFNNSTFSSALMAAGSAISLVEALCTEKIQNGMAIIRPPGHHAMTDTYCGFCYFNNVAIAAKYALEKNLAKKILIVDIDVHHGQATQETFYYSDNVLYFSVHRYEHGAFWPNLRESNFDHIGEGAGKGFNINVPLNVHGLQDSDYLAIVLQILLPVAYEFNPDLIIVSAGYDACLGCPEGEMMVSPAFYGHLITLLSGIANAKVAVCLEGGYFLPSLAEGVWMTIKALLGDACADLNDIGKPHHTVVDTINNLRIVLRRYWKCFRMYSACPSITGYQDEHKATVKYVGVPPVPPYPTRNCYPTLPSLLDKFYTETIGKLAAEYAHVGNNQDVGCCFHPGMLLHKSEKTHVENPTRLSAIRDLYKDWKLDVRCRNIEPQTFNIDILREVHGDEFVTQIVDGKFSSIVKGKSDMYYNKHTAEAIMMANSCLLTITNAVLKGICRSGVALIRPPGHHAESQNAMGFCFINNVAVAAKQLLKECDRVAIIDFDIHHGNGTQNIFYGDNRVMYISIHKFFPDHFFPNTTEGDSTYCGEGSGKGYNVNVALKGLNMNDVDYITIFFSVILPILYSFKPEFILVSAGFDAGVNDPLGKYKLSPECFGHFVQLLKPLAKGRIILVLEGGYNPTTVKYGMNICIKALLGDPLPRLECGKGLHSKTMQAIARVKSIHREFWPVLDIDKKLKFGPIIEENMCADSQAT